MKKMESKSKITYPKVFETNHNSFDHFLLLAKTIQILAVSHACFFFVSEIFEFRLKMNSKPINLIAHLLYFWFRSQMLFSFVEISILCFLIHFPHTTTKCKEIHLHLIILNSFGRQIWPRFWLWFIWSFFSFQQILHLSFQVLEFWAFYLHL